MKLSYVIAFLNWPLTLFFVANGCTQVSELICTGFIIGALGLLGMIIENKK